MNFIERLKQYSASQALKGNSSIEELDKIIEEEGEKIRKSEEWRVKFKEDCGGGTAFRKICFKKYCACLVRDIARKIVVCDQMQDENLELKVIIGMNRLTFDPDLDDDDDEDTDDKLKRLLSLTNKDHYLKGKFYHNRDPNFTDDLIKALVLYLREDYRIACEQEGVTPKYSRHE